LLPFLQEVGDPAKLLRSPDDGEEYIICWNRDILNTSGNGFPVIAYEKLGKGGERYVGRGRTVEHLTDEAFQNLLTATVP
jgi:hypothetical protein